MTAERLAWPLMKFDELVLRLWLLPASWCFCSAISTHRSDNMASLADVTQVYVYRTSGPPLKLDCFFIYVRLFQCFLRTFIEVIAGNLTAASIVTKSL